MPGLGPQPLIRGPSAVDLSVSTGAPTRGHPWGILRGRRKPGTGRSGPGREGWSSPGFSPGLGPGWTGEGVGGGLAMVAPRGVSG